MAADEARGAPFEVDGEEPAILELEPNKFGSALVALYSANLHLYQPVSEVFDDDFPLRLYRAGRMQIELWFEKMVCPTPYTSRKAFSSRSATLRFPQGNGTLRFEGLCLAGIGSVLRMPGDVTHIGFGHFEASYCSYEPFDPEEVSWSVSSDQSLEYTPLTVSV